VVGKRDKRDREEVRVGQVSVRSERGETERVEWYAEQRERGVRESRSLRTDSVRAYTVWGVRTLHTVGC